MFADTDSPTGRSLVYPAQIDSGTVEQAKKNVLDEYISIYGPRDGLPGQAHREGVLEIDLNSVFRPCVGKFKAEYPLGRPLCELTEGEGC
jgi:hypothetical protein